MRNYSLDILKFLCAVVVVFLHVKTPLHSYYVPLTRFAVPCFFIISGYFLMGQNMDERMERGSKRVLRIILYSSILFATVQLILHHFNLASIVPSVKEIVAFVLLNDNPWGFHLWYLSAYLYVLLICRAICKYDKWNLAYFLVPVLLVTDLLLGKYSVFFFNIEVPYELVRNFMFVGLPYFLIGTYIRRHERVLCLNKELLMGGAVLFLFTSLLENRLLVHLGLNATRDHYLSTTPLAISLFLLFLNYHKNESSLLSRIGRDDSLFIYILHPVWILFFKKTNHYLPELWIDIYSYIAPLLILGLTMTLIAILRKTKIIR